ncbi:unnamed protein product [Haemonchus placei]|uniref:Helitron_like_N domain-containing protein n=1 Tax=Haemonchus placei TaxID=6290 RepID=A0A0N4WEI6_HAEPC|nr:unnamed protein product [Haemonchus placei]
MIQYLMENDRMIPNIWFYRNLEEYCIDVARTACGPQPGVELGDKNASKDGLKMEKEIKLPYCLPSSHS